MDGTSLQLAVLHLKHIFSKGIKKMTRNKKMKMGYPIKVVWGV